MVFVVCEVVVSFIKMFWDFIVLLIKGYIMKLKRGRRDSVGGGEII